MCAAQDLLSAAKNLLIVIDSVVSFESHLESMHSFGENAVLVTACTRLAFFRREHQVNVASLSTGQSLSLLRRVMEEHGRLKRFFKLTSSVKQCLSLRRLLGLDLENNPGAIKRLAFHLMSSKTDDSITIYSLLADMDTQHFLGRSSLVLEACDSVTASVHCLHDRQALVLLVMLSWLPSGGVPVSFLSLVTCHLKIGNHGNQVGRAIDKLCQLGLVSPRSTGQSATIEMPSFVKMSLNGRLLHFVSNNIIEETTEALVWSFCQLCLAWTVGVGGHLTKMSALVNCLESDFDFDELQEIVKSFIVCTHHFLSTKNLTRSLACQLVCIQFSSTKDDDSHRIWFDQAVSGFVYSRNLLAELSTMGFEECLFMTVAWAVGVDSAALIALEQARAVAENEDNTSNTSLVAILSAVLDDKMAIRCLAEWMRGSDFTFEPLLAHPLGVFLLYKVAKVKWFLREPFGEVVASIRNCLKTKSQEVWPHPPLGCFSVYQTLCVAQGHIELGDEFAKEKNVEVAFSHYNAAYVTLEWSHCRSRAVRAGHIVIGVKRLHVLLDLPPDVVVQQTAFERAFGDSLAKLREDILFFHCGLPHFLTLPVTHVIIQAQLKLGQRGLARSVFDAMHEQCDSNHGCDLPFSELLAQMAAATLDSDSKTFQKYFQRACLKLSSMHVLRRHATRVLQLYSALQQYYWYHGNCELFSDVTACMLCVADEYCQHFGLLRSQPRQILHLLACSTIRTHAIQSIKRVMEICRQTGNADLVLLLTKQCKWLEKAEHDIVTSK